MMNGKEKSEIRRQRAATAISALDIPGVFTTRNLEAWLIECGRKGDVVKFVVLPHSVDPAEAQDGD